MIISRFTCNPYSSCNETLCKRTGVRMLQTILRLFAFSTTQTPLPCGDDTALISLRTHSQIPLDHRRISVPACANSRRRKWCVRFSTNSLVRPTPFSGRSHQSSAAREMFLVRSHGLTVYCGDSFRLDKLEGGTLNTGERSRSSTALWFATSNVGPGLLWRRQLEEQPLRIWICPLQGAKTIGSGVVRRRG